MIFLCVCFCVGVARKNIIRHCRLVLFDSSGYSFPMDRRRSEAGLTNDAVSEGTPYRMSVAPPKMAVPRLNGLFGPIEFRDLTFERIRDA